MVFTKKNKNDEEHDAGLNNPEVSPRVEQSDENEIDKFLKGETNEKDLEEIKSEISVKDDNEESITINPKDVEQIARMIKDASKPKLSQTTVKITAFEQKDDTIYFGFSNENLSEKQIDAMVSLLNNEFMIEHNKRNFVSISHINKNGKK